MSDNITILRHSSALAKTWRADGTIGDYNHAKYFGFEQKAVGNIQELTALLQNLEADPNACVIRGTYKGNEHAQVHDPDFKQGKTRRLAKLFDDSPHHWVLVEVDEFEPLTCDPVDDPKSAIQEYIGSCLPQCFHTASCYWQLSNSAGHAKNAGKLKVHLWFWLSTPYNSAQLKAWADFNKLALDKAVLNTVQIHYTAAPIFEAGVKDPVVHRSGFMDGLIGDDVDLQIDAELLAQAKTVTASDSDDDEDVFGNLPVGLSLEDARKLLKDLPGHDYKELWIKAGMALHHEFSGDKAALALWDEWSQTSDKYGGYDLCVEKWGTFNSDKGDGVTARWLIKFGREATKSAESAQRHAALEEIKNSILACNDGSLLLSDIARKAGPVVTADIGMRAEVIAAIAGRFKAITGAKVSVPDIRMALNSGVACETRGLDGRHELTETGNAMRMLDRYGDDLMFVPETEAWFTWNGSYWQRSTAAEILHYAIATVEALPKELPQIASDDERANHRKFSKLSQTYKMYDCMFKTMRSMPKILRRISLLDSEQNLLCCSNGAVDLTTGELLEPDRSHLMTICTGVEYSPNAQCPVFAETVLDAFFGDTEMLAFFQRLIGYIAMGQPKESIILIPYGSGNNGKSTVFKAISMALGGYAKTAYSTTFLGEARGNAGGPREDILRLFKSRFVYSTEPDEGAELKEGLIKAMSGGEALPARGINGKHTVEVMPTWTVVMPTNHKPIIKGDDYGIWRRIMLVPFTRNYDDDPTVKKDVHRSAKLMKELPGILNWIVQGALAYQKMGLKPPKAVVDAKREYRKEMDLLEEWLETCCVVSPEQEASAEDLFQSWKGYAERNGVLRMLPSKNHLSRKLVGRFEKKLLGKRKISGFAGVGLRHDFGESTL